MYGKIPEGYQQFAPALYNIEQQNEQAVTEMYNTLLKDTPDIAKASIISHLGDYPSRQTLMTSIQMLKAKKADTCRAALLSLEAFPAEHTMAYIFPLLTDPVKIVRLEAARIVSAIGKDNMSEKHQEILEQAIEEYRQSLLFAADRPETQLALAQLYSNEAKPRLSKWPYFIVIILLFFGFHLKNS